MPLKSPNPSYKNRTHQSSGTTNQSRINANDAYHRKRLERNQERMVTFKEECARLASYFGSDQGQPTVIGGEEQLSSENDLELIEPEEYTIITQSNIAHLSQLFRMRTITDHRPYYGHVIKLAKLRPAFRNQLCNEMIRLLRYFTTPIPSNTSGGGSQLSIRRTTSSMSQINQNRTYYFTETIGIYLMESEQRLLIVHDQFPLESNLQNVIWSGSWTDSYDMAMVKQWTGQLADAIEMLNQAGVAHRFIRPENVLLVGEDRNIRLGSFDFACLYCDIFSGSYEPIPLHPRALPFDLEPHLLDHLPPEVFTDGYDASMIDVWSLGVIICQLLTNHNPFDRLIDSCMANGTDLNINDCIKRWKSYPGRRTISEEIRSLLDDIFRDASNRIPSFELNEDRRLVYKDAKEFLKIKPPQWYRIDLNRNLNVNPPPQPSHRKLRVPISEMTFAPESSEIFVHVGFNEINGDESAITNYTILRDQSFNGDLESPYIINDWYLKATKLRSVGNLRPQKHHHQQQQQSHLEVSNEPCLVKIYSLKSIPTRHRNMLLNESGKIMRYLSNCDRQIHRHKVFDIFLINVTLYMFFESLHQYQSIRYLIETYLSSNNCLPPPIRTQNVGSLITLINVRHWIVNLTETVKYMTSHGISHRYIRPEFVFVNEAFGGQQIKLSHFDMACFAWNPEKMMIIPRTYCIQDELEYMWDHLPPECYDHWYDCRQVDIWSVGVLLAYCLVGVGPFDSPLTCEQSRDQWQRFKQTHRKSLNTCLTFIELLDQIFVPFEQRMEVEIFSERLRLIPISLGPSTSVNRRKSNDTIQGRMKKSNSNDSLHPRRNTICAKSKRIVTKNNQNQSKMGTHNSNRMCVRSRSADINRKYSPVVDSSAIINSNINSVTNPKSELHYPFNNGNSRSNHPDMSSTELDGQREVSKSKKET